MIDKNTKNNIYPETPSDTTDETEKSAETCKQIQLNKHMHSLHGNIKTIDDNFSILQINTSNANWSTKKDELLSTIIEHNADVTIVSEANPELNDQIKMTERTAMFKNYNLEDKPLNNSDKSRVSIIVKKGIEYKRMTDCETDDNSTIILKFKEAHSKWLF